MIGPQAVVITHNQAAAVSQKNHECKTQGLL